MAGTAGDEAAPLVGRDQEQSLLRSLLDEVATRGQALVLRGEPGIGKSRLLSDTARTARERGMLVLSTAGVQTEAHLPFAGLHQLLRPVRAYTAELPAAQRAALDAAFGLTHDVAPEHYRIAMAALDLVSEVATESRRCCKTRALLGRLERNPENRAAYQPTPATLWLTLAQGATNNHLQNRR